MAPNSSNLLAFAQSLSGHEPPEAVTDKALDCALATLGEGVGLALIRTPLGASRVAARRGIGPEGDAAARALYAPGTPIARALEEGWPQLFIDDGRLAPVIGTLLPGREVRCIAVIPFPALGKSVGGMLLFLRQEPDKPLWEECLPHLGGITGLALGQVRLRETMARQGRLASLGRVAAGVAHELRNPLTVLGTILELLQQDSHLATETREKLDRAQGAFKRVVKVIDGLSEYSKPAKPLAGLVPLSDLFSTVLDLVGADARARKIDIAARTSPALAVRGDRGQLLEILVNLVENAIDAIESEGRITLEADQTSGEVRISVRDSGPGIAPDLLEQIFDPFFTTKANGTGLGLALVGEIVEQLGGTIRVESEPGAGTRFYVSFPSV